MAIILPTLMPPGWIDADCSVCRPLFAGVDQKVVPFMAILGQVAPRKKFARQAQLREWGMSAQQVEREALEDWFKKLGAAYVESSGMLMLMKHFAALAILDPSAFEAAHRRWGDWLLVGIPDLSTMCVTPPELGTTMHLRSLKVSSPWSTPCSRYSKAEFTVWFQPPAIWPPSGSNGQTAQQRCCSLAPPAPLRGCNRDQAR